MTQTTTELVLDIEENFVGEYFGHAHQSWDDLNDRLSSGESLPDQWKGKSDRDVVEKWVRKEWHSRSAYLGFLTANQATLTLRDCGNNTAFDGPTPDDAYHLAAEWVRGQGG